MTAVSGRRSAVDSRPASFDGSTEFPRSRRGRLRRRDVAWQHAKSGVDYNREHGPVAQW